MTERVWLECADARPMLEALWQHFGGDESILVPRIHRYLIACCRRIWRLLPDKGSRLGIEVAERFVEGEASVRKLRKTAWYAEESAFTIDYDTDPPAVQRWIEQTRAIARHELAALLYPPDLADELDIRRLLMRAAYFAHFAASFPFQMRMSFFWRPEHPACSSYSLFLSAQLLREVFGNPFSAKL
jgi:hypothetical protein